MMLLFHLLIQVTKSYQIVQLNSCQIILRNVNLVLFVSLVTTLFYLLKVASLHM